MLQGLGYGHHGKQKSEEVVGKISFLITDLSIILALAFLPNDALQWCHSLKSLPLPGSQMNLRSVFTAEQQRILERYYDNGMTNQSKACFQLILQCAQEAKLDFSVVRVLFNALFQHLFNVFVIILLSPYCVELFVS